MGAAWNWRALWARHPTRPRPKVRPREREREFELSLWWEWGLLPRLNLTSSVDMVDKSPWCTHTHTPFMTWVGLSRHLQPCHFASSNDTRGAMSDVSLCSQSWENMWLLTGSAATPWLVPQIFYVYFAVNKMININWSSMFIARWYLLRQKTLSTSVTLFVI